MKKCKKCGMNFEGINCKPCKAAYIKDWSSKNPDKIKEIKRRTYLKNKEKHKQRNEKWANENLERSNNIKKAWKKRNREKYLAQQREYARKRYVDNREKLLDERGTSEKKEVDRKWREENRQRLNAEYLKRYHESDDMKRKHSMRNKVCRALKMGKLIKASECSLCGVQEKLQAHHKDYSNALSVIWVCIPCHKKIHSKYFKPEEK